MAKIFKGKLPASQREISIVTVGGVAHRSWDRGLTLRQAHGMKPVRSAEPGSPLVVEHAIVADSGRGEIVRSLGQLEGVVHAAGVLPVELG